MRRFLCKWIKTYTCGALWLMWLSSTSLYWIHILRLLQWMKRGLKFIMCVVLIKKLWKMHVLTLKHKLDIEKFPTQSLWIVNKKRILMIVEFFFMKCIAQYDATVKGHEIKIEWITTDSKKHYVFSWTHQTDQGYYFKSYRFWNFLFLIGALLLSHALVFLIGWYVTTKIDLIIDRQSRRCSFVTDGLPTLTTLSAKFCQ